MDMNFGKADTAKRGNQNISLFNPKTHFLSSGNLLLELDRLILEFEIFECLKELWKIRNS